MSQKLLMSRWWLISLGVWSFGQNHNEEEVKTTAVYFWLPCWHQCRTFLTKKEKKYARDVDFVTEPLEIWRNNLSPLQKTAALQFCSSAKQTEGAWCKWAKRLLRGLSLNKDVAAEEGRRKVSVAESHKWFPLIKIPTGFLSASPITGDKDEHKKNDHFGGEESCAKDKRKPHCHHGLRVTWLPFKCSS